MQALLPCPSWFVVSICAACAMFPFPRSHFSQCFSTSYVCLLPTCPCSFQLFCICHLCLFQVVFICYHVLSQTYIVQCICFAIVIFAFLKLAFFNSIFFAIVMFAFLKLACFIRIFFAIVIFAFLKLAFFICIFVAFVIFAFLWVAFFNPIFFALFLLFFKLNIF